MSEVSYKEISNEEDGQRLDNYLIRILKGVPKSHIYRIIRAGEVRVNKKEPKLIQGYMLVIAYEFLQFGCQNQKRFLLVIL
ncbi:ribosomal large subunit pseudouridine synthase [Legionella sainthelensi]|nr:S4 domain-containing protein [Legionella sainthelensi]VEH28313.1 ribosomal large subunit pseudouridine synthase [Legionella sainthelensi]